MAQGPATAEELAARARTVTAFAAKVRSRPPARAKTKLTFAFPKFAAKVLAIAAPVIVLAGGVVAATDSLPPSAQTAVSGALSNLGISVPEPHDDHHGIAASPPASTGIAAPMSTGPDVGPRAQATVGLCRAWRAGRLDSHSASYRNLTTAAGGAAHIAAHCAGALASSAPDRATAHVVNPSTAPIHRGPPIHRGQAVTRPTATGAQKTAAPVAPSRQGAIALRRLRALVGGHPAASTSAPPTTKSQHGPKALGTSRHPVGSPNPAPVSAGVVAPQGTHGATTATTPAPGHRPSKKAGGRKPPAPTSSTLGTTPPVSTPPAPSSGLAGRATSGHHGLTGHHRRPRSCTNSAPSGQSKQPRHDCHPVTPTGSKSDATSPGNATSSGSVRNGARSSTSGPTVGSKPRSVKHRKGM
jgi:hypothetical protein